MARNERKMVAKNTKKKNQKWTKTRANITTRKASTAAAVAAAILAAERR